MSASLDVQVLLNSTRTLMRRLREALEFRKAKSTVSWSIAVLLEVSGRAAKTALSRTRGPDVRLVAGSSEVEVGGGLQHDELSVLTRC